MNHSTPKNKVNISRVKKFAFELPKDWPLREILLAEKDEISLSAFLERLPIWLQLSMLKGASKG